LAGNVDLCLVKYDNSGNYQWNRTWGGDSDEWARCMAIDPFDNIYLVGERSRIINSTMIWELCLVKYNNLGVLQWGRAYQRLMADSTYTITCDSSGNFYLGGKTLAGSEASDNLFIEKYDSLGEMKWSHIWGSEGADACHGLTLDSNDNIYVAGDWYNSMYIAKLIETPITTQPPIPGYDLWLIISLISIISIFTIISKTFKAKLRDYSK